MKTKDCRGEGGALKRALDPSFWPQHQGRAGCVCVSLRKGQGYEVRVTLRGSRSAQAFTWQYLWCTALPAGAGQKS